MNFFVLLVRIFVQVQSSNWRRTPNHVHNHSSPWVCGTLRVRGASQKNATEAHGFHKCTSHTTDSGGPTTKALGFRRFRSHGKVPLLPSAKLTSLPAPSAV